MTVTPNTRPIGHKPERRNTFNARLARARRKHPPVGENSRDRFVRLATSRITRAVHDLRLIGNLANRHVYKYDSDDVEIMNSYISDATLECFAQFRVKPEPKVEIDHKRAT